MKKFLVSITISGALICGLCAAAMAQSRANFSGTWALDLKKTRDVPPDLKSYTLTVKHEDQQITFDSRVEGDPNPSAKPDHDNHVVGPPPHPTASTTGIASGTTPSNENGPGTSNSRTVMARGRALAMVVRHMNCTLDGKEVAREVGGIAPGSIRRKAFWRRGDKTLEFSIARDFDIQGSKFTSTVKELWELSDDGKTLKIKRTVNLLAGWDETMLVFNKQ